MATKPISFCPELVRALLNTKPDVYPAEPLDPSLPFKWQTRRVVKPQPELHVEPAEGEEGCDCFEPRGWPHWVYKGWTSPTIPPPLALGEGAPYQPGDVLYVREGLIKEVGVAAYRADMRLVQPLLPWRWKHSYLPSIFMPKEAARLWLLVKAVRAEQVQKIEGSDAVAEGFLECYLVRDFWIRLWDHLNAKRGYPWADNPWVWVYTFMRLSVPPDTS